MPKEERPPEGSQESQTDDDRLIELVNEAEAARIAKEVLERDQARGAVSLKGSTLPRGQMRLEGTDDVELVTDQPQPAPKSRDKGEPQEEKLFTTKSEKPAQPSGRRTPRRVPVRGRLAELADTNAAKREVENELAARPLPEDAEDRKAKLKKQLDEQNPDSLGRIG